MQSNTATSGKHGSGAEAAQKAPVSPTSTTDSPPVDANQDARQRHQQSRPILDGSTEQRAASSGSEAEWAHSAPRLAGEGAHGQETQSVKYWHYKQTGIKSRPIKLIRHPIEHLGRKVVFTYILALVLKLIAIFTGPLVVLIAYLFTVPFTLARRSIWFILNLPCLFDARIRTKGDFEDDEPVTNEPAISGGERQVKVLRQTEWNYCPLSYLETYWFKEKLVNHAILVISNEDSNAFSIDKLRDLIVRNTLSKPSFRKFLSRVVAHGLPYYRSYYWKYIGLQDDARLDIEEQKPDKQPGNQHDLSSVSGDSSTTADDRLSITSTGAFANSSIEIAMPPMQQGAPDTVCLASHIFEDKSVECSDVNLESVRRLVHGLLDIDLDMTRPLWEIRVISGQSKTYLVLRCHQSLVDGKSLAGILSQCLADTDLSNYEQLWRDKMAKETSRHTTDEVQSPESIDDDHAERLLRPIKEKPSFVNRVRRANSFKSILFVAPLTVFLWVIWSFTRRKNNHLNRCTQSSSCPPNNAANYLNSRRFYMAKYDLTKFFQIKQTTRSTVTDIVLCALSGALRDYLRKFNCVSNPPNLNISLTVDMRQPDTSNVCTPDCPVTHGSEKKLDGQKAAAVRCTLVNVPLPTSVEGTVPRLWDLRNTMDELRSSADPWVMLSLQKFLFSFLPVSWYQGIMNFITLRNSSTFVSNIRGPQNMVESWCVDLTQRAIFEAQQPPREYKADALTSSSVKLLEETDNRAQQLRSKLERLCRSKLDCDLGTISAIYYCMQPPTSAIPISFNCITYHNKFFVTCLSRSLLVEDSKLLIRLFYKQLDQLADTIAKRRSLITIIRTPVPIEISCQPASPDRQSPADTIVDKRDALTFDRHTEFERCMAEEQINARRSPTLHRGPKDDLEADIGAEWRMNRCQACKQTVCVCKRRKSMLSFDQNKQRAINLLSLLHPSVLNNARNSRNNENQADDRQEECVCGQLDNLDEEMDKIAEDYGDGEMGGSALRGSRTPNDMRTNSNSRQRCKRCRGLFGRSSISLDSLPDNHMRDARRVDQRQISNESCEMNIGDSSQSINSKDATRSSGQLNIPRGSRINSDGHSRSEASLVPAKSKGRGASLKRAKEPWRSMGYDHNPDSQPRSKSPSSGKKSVAQRTAFPAAKSSTIHSRAKHLFESPVDYIGRHLGDSSRRQSVATTSGVANMQRVVVVKDEINADVSLRCQVDGQFLGISNRRFSAIGNVVAGSQRRASLIPFGLVPNQSLPKLFKVDSETHL